MNCETEDLFGSYPPYIESAACSFSLIGDDSRMIIIKFEAIIIPLSIQYSSC